MEIGTAVVGFILIAICALPFGIVFFNEIKVKRQRLARIRELADKQGRPVSQYDIGGDFIIGMDDTPKHVYFYKTHPGDDVEQVVNLEDITACKVIRMNRTVGTIGLLSGVELAFIPVGREQKETRLVFYNELQKASLSNELELAEKWSKLIQERLKRA
jgi:hypothetical protein